MKGKIVAEWLVLNLVKISFKINDLTPGTAVFQDFVKPSLLSNTYISHNIDTIYSQQTKMANTCKIVSLDSLRFSLICKNSVTYSNH